MNGIDFGTLLRLDKPKQVSFGYLTAKRFFKSYEIFSFDSGFGNIAVMKEAMKFSYDFIVSPNINDYALTMHIMEVDENIPDMDDFGSLISSAALDTGVIIFETLNIFKGNKNYKSIESISSSATDSINRIVQELEGLKPNDKNLEHKISSHPLMIEEIKIQNGIIAFLKKIERVDENDLATLEEIQNNSLYKELDLRKVLDE